MIQIENLYKSYQMKNVRTPVLKNLNFQIDKGDFVALRGQSGAGKSTLLNIIAILDSYDSGSYYINNTLIKDLTNQQATKYRNQFIGFIFQQFHLIPFKTALENVALPLYYQKVEKKERYERSLQMLNKVDLAVHVHKKPSELSGGQQQRVAIARALVTNPPLILADEPTGALDSTTGQEIVNLLKKMNKEGNTILIVTHESKIAAQCNKTREIVDGVIVS